MEISIIPALAGLTGAAIGGLTSGIASWFAQKTQSRVQLLAQKRVPRQELYKEFIEVATQCYADALQHEKPDIPALVNLYGKIGRMRVLSSPRVLASFAIAASGGSAFPGIGSNDQAASGHRSPLYVSTRVRPSSGGSPSF